MMTQASDAGMHTLWGTPQSLFTGKIRSYLIKKGIPCRELCTTHPRFRDEVRPAIRLVRPMERRDYMLVLA